jgi:glucose-6-phosphate 1-dehydrogenase
MAAYAEGMNILRHADAGKHSREHDAETTPLSHPEHYQYQLPLREIAEAWRHGSVISSWLLDLIANALREDEALSAYAGHVSDSGEGRWTLNAAIDIGVPAPVLYTALAARFSSRGGQDYADKLLSALRFQCAGEHSDALVFFGATGDLAYKKIFPAMQALVKRGSLTVPVIGVARPGWTLERLRARAKESLEQHGSFDPEAFKKLSQSLRYVEGEYSDPLSFDRLREALGRAKRPLHYLAIPPSMFAVVVRELGRSGCAEGARVVIEKPFGRDLESARALNRTLLSVFPESSIFRIDHYLGKEPVQNLLYFRFSNSFLEPLWNRTHVQRCDITMAETLGVEGRGKLYEETGAIRDVIQNHMLQLVTSVAMDPPTSHDIEAQRDEKTRLLRAIRPISAEDVVRGQYLGYRSEEAVAPDSNVETFAALRVHIDNWRWAGVPFCLRAGKHMPVARTEVMVWFKPPPYSVFGEDLCAGERTNYMRFRLGPDVAIAQGVRSKVPGEAMVGREVELVATQIPGDQQDAYARLLGDAMRGDPTLFAREDAIEEQWRIVQPILGNVTPLHAYERGTWGSPEAARLTDWISEDCADRGGKDA